MTPQTSRTPEQDAARRSLAEADSTSLAGPRDRRVHAVAVAGFGLLVGGYVALGRLDRQDGSGSWGLGAYIALLVLLAAWQTRASAALPRGTRRTGWTGLAGTLVLCAVVQGWLNWREQTTASGPVLLVVVSLVAALPALLAAAAVLRGNRR